MLPFAIGGVVTQWSPSQSPTFTLCRSPMAVARALSPAVQGISYCLSSVRCLDSGSMWPISVFSTLVEEIDTCSTPSPPLPSLE